MVIYLLLIVSLGFLVTIPPRENRCFAEEFQEGTLVVGKITGKTIPGKKILMVWVTNTQKNILF